MATGTLPRFEYKTNKKNCTLLMVTVTENLLCSNIWTVFPSCAVPSLTDKHGQNYRTNSNSDEEILLVTCSRKNCCLTNSMLSFNLTK